MLNRFCRIDSYCPLLPWNTLLPSVLRVLDVLAKSVFNAREVDRILECMRACLEFIFFGTTDQHEQLWIIHALDQGFLLHVARLHVWVNWATPRNIAAGSLHSYNRFLEDCVCASLIYSSVLRSASQAVDGVTCIGSDNDGQTLELNVSAWKLLVQLSNYIRKYWKALMMMCACGNRSVNIKLVSDRSSRRQLLLVSRRQT